MSLARTTSSIARSASAVASSSSSSSQSCSSLLRRNQALAARFTAPSSSSAAAAGQCPCCFGAVHRRSGANSGLNPALAPFFRKFSTKSGTGGASVVSLIKEEHRDVEQDFKKYTEATSIAEKTKLGQLIVKKISQHGAQEEMSVYPWMKEHDASLKKMVDHGIHEHGKLKEDLVALDKLDASDPKFDTMLQRVWKDLSHHIKEEESSILPALEKIASKEQLSALGAKFLEMKSIAPTRPHPMGPTAGGIGTKMANAGATVTDAMRDAVQGRPKA